MFLNWTRNPKTRWLLVWLFCGFLLVIQPVGILRRAFRKPDDFDLVITHLRARGPLPPEEAGVVPKVMDKYGSIRKALRFGSSFKMTLVNGRFQLEKGDYSQATYLALFGSDRLPRLVSITGYIGEDSHFRYDIAVDEIRGLVVLDVGLTAVLIFALVKWKRTRIIVL